jgi:hypothetical protein
MAVALLLPLLAACGAGLPAELTTVRAAGYATPPPEAWRLVATLAAEDAAAVAAWRTDLRETRAAAPMRGHVTWLETDPDGGVARWETVEVFEGRKLVRCVVPAQDGEVPEVGGCVTWEVAPRDEGSTVVLTETVRFHGDLYRWTHAPGDRSRALDRTLDALGSALGSPPLVHADGLREVRTALKP